MEHHKSLDAIDLADVLASMGVVPNSSLSSPQGTVVHFHHHPPAPAPANPFAPTLDSLVFRRASAPTPAPANPPSRASLWRSATDGHVDTTMVDTSSLLLHTLFNNAQPSGSGVWTTPPQPPPVTQLPEEAQLARLTRRDVYSFSKLSAVFHLPQHQACSELRRAMEAEGQVGYRLRYVTHYVSMLHLQLYLRDSCTVCANSSTCLVWQESVVACT